MKQKTFYSILSTFSENPQRAKEGLSDKRLTSLEKMILLGYLDLRDNKNTEVIQNLLKTPNDAPDFVLAQKKLLLSFAYMNLTHYEESLKYLLEVLPYFSLGRMDYFEFITKINLFINYLNTSNLSEMTSTIKSLEEMTLVNNKSKIRLLMCQFFFYNFKNDDEKIQNTLNSIDQFKDVMLESDIVAHSINVFRYYITKDNFGMASKVIDELVNHRKFRIKQDFNYLKKLFEHYTQNKPLYFSENDFNESPVIYWEMRVIQKLEEMDIESAKSYWQKLHQSNPDLYGPHFNFIGEKCIFSLCLNKHLTRIEQSNVLIKKIPDENNSTNHLEKLFHLFKNSTAPISKEFIYQQLWGEKPDTKADLIKLSNTIARFKQKYGYNLKTRKGCYFIDESDLSKKAS